MKNKYIAMAMASALLTAGLVPLASAQSELRSAPEGIEVITVVGMRTAPEGIEVITVVGKRTVPEGIEVITVVGKRPEQTVASACVDEVMGGRIGTNRNLSDAVNAQEAESRSVRRDIARQAIRACIEQAQMGTVQS